jgi:hypothetical protein
MLCCAASILHSVCPAVVCNNNFTQARHYSLLSTSSCIYALAPVYRGWNSVHLVGSLTVPSKVFAMLTGKNSLHSQVAVRQRQAHCHLCPCYTFFITPFILPYLLELYVFHSCSLCLKRFLLHPLIWCLSLAVFVPPPY